MQTRILKIALVTPSSPFDENELQSALQKAYELQLSVVGPTKKRNAAPAFLNGRKEERLAELFEAEAQGADALWCTRGGCGALELWHDYSFEFYNNKKIPLIGYSDATILHFIRYYRAERIGIHGPGFLEFFDQLSTLRLLIENKAQQISYPPLKKRTHFLPTQIKGELIVMNLLSLQSLIGSFDPGFLRKKILAIEEVKEPHYKIFRAIWQLKNAGILIGLKALIVGHLPNDREQIIRETLMPIAEDLAIPLFDWPIFGHDKPNWPLLFGAVVNIRQVDKTLFTLCYEEQHDHTPIIDENINAQHVELN